MAAITHELRSPLGAIVMAAATLQRLPLETRGPDIDAQLTQVLDRASRQMRDTLDQVVALQRAVTGHDQLALGEVSVAAAVEGAIAAVPEPERARLQIARPLPALRARGDKGALEIVLGNLFSNALRHGADAPVDVRVGCPPGSDDVAVEVRDRGTGFSDLQNAAKPWRQGSRGPRGGFGLGLYIAGTLMDAMGGRMHLANPGDGGAHVTVVLVSAPGVA